MDGKSQLYRYDVYEEWIARKGRQFTIYTSYSESQFKINNVITGYCKAIIYCPTNWSIFSVSVSLSHTHKHFYILYIEWNTSREENVLEHLLLFRANNKLVVEIASRLMLQQSNGTTQDAILLHEYYIASPGLFRVFTTPNPLAHCKSSYTQHQALYALPTYSCRWIFARMFYSENASLTSEL